jgi:hypothetical protein
MAIKKICQAGWLCLGLFAIATAAAQNNPFGQSFQINTYLKSYVGQPTWVIIVRDEDNGQVLPYQFYFSELNNFWIGFTFAHSYRVIVSDLQFGPPNAIIHNFCHLQDGILDRQSISVTLQGDLTPNRHTSQCHVMRYKNYSFPIANSNDDVSDNTSTTNAATSGVGALTKAFSGSTVGAVSEGISKLISSK